MRERVCLEVGPEGWHRCFANLFGGVFAPNIVFWKLFRSGSWVCLVIIFIIILIFLCPLSRIFPSCACMHLFLLLYSSFYFVSWGDICLGTSTSAKGPRFQPISVLFLVQKGRNSYKWRFLLQCKYFLQKGKFSEPLLCLLFLKNNQLKTVCQSAASWVDLSCFPSERMNRWSTGNS